MPYAYDVSHRQISTDFAGAWYEMEYVLICSAGALEVRRKGHSYLQKSPGRDTVGLKGAELA